MKEYLTKKQSAWLRPELRNVELKSGLYLLATPIGNLSDITLRALDVLSLADMVVCEDTRVTGKLLSHFGMRKPLFSYNDYNADKQRGSIIEAVSNGKLVALVSDAGTPLVNDPGYKLVRDCIDLGLYVSALPGANAPLTALQLSGLPSDKFCFLGFLPSKSVARCKVLEEWKCVSASLIVFETAQRLLASLEDICTVLGECSVAVVREMTKLYEEVRRGNVSDLILHYKKEGAPKGEIVLVIGAVGEQKMSDGEVTEKLRCALTTMGTKEAASYVAEISNKSRREIYNLALELLKDNDG
ncbi:MAG: 16S rRNA (cytidine(1402)-2'-O)-methyltransferase [Alphaproteobacteria bacterium]|nr:16S rRNA (cytidine(1402)-2'-O)-methyltransferase [Alphaproteobacteria bacterium]